ncbi:MAG: GNAT family N-acetyltransferase [Ardenticatenaceae bacterium]
MISYAQQEKTAMLPIGFTMRPMVEADIEAVVALLNLCSIAEIGAPDFTVEQFANELRIPGIAWELDTRVVYSPDGQLVGYQDILPLKEPPVHPLTWGKVHPDFEGMGIGTALLIWGEARARQLMGRAPGDLRVTLRAFALSTHLPTQRLLRSFGMAPIRYYLQMRIELNEAPPVPAWPTGIALRPFDRERDALAVYQALDEAFSDHWGHQEQPPEEGFKQWAHFVFNPENYDPTLWFIATDGDEIAGVSRCHLNLPEDPELGWVAQLAVRRAWRRRGLALALLHHSFDAFYRRGRKRVGLSVDAENLTGAVRLYACAGMHAIRQYDTYEKELRAGREA